MEAELKQLKNELTSEKSAMKKLKHAMDTVQEENISLSEKLQANHEGLRALQLKADVYKERVDESSLETVQNVKQENAGLVEQNKELMQLLKEKEAELTSLARISAESFKKSEINATLVEQIKELKQLLEEKEVELTTLAHVSAESFKKSEVLIGELEKRLIDAVDSERRLVERHEEEKQQLILKICALTNSIGVLREELRKEQERAKETLMMFQSVWRNAATKNVGLPKVS